MKTLSIETSCDDTSLAIVRYEDGSFFVDQLQQLGCKLFTKALARLKSKKNLWERKRSYFFNHFISRLEDLWSALAYGHVGKPLDYIINTS